MVTDSQIIDSVYAVSLDPERYDDLVKIWVDRISTSLDTNTGFNPPQLDNHLQRAMEMIALLATSQTDKSVVDTANRGSNQPNMAFDDRGNLQRTNPAAQSSYAMQLGQPLEDLPFDGLAHRDLRSALAAKAKREPETGLIRAIRTDNGLTVLMTVNRLAEDDPATIVVETTDLVWPERLTGVLQESFGLTSAEANIGRLLVAGASVAEIAAQRSRAVDTVRTQLRSLFGKTSTTSQTEFVRMAVGLAALYPSEQIADAGESATKVHQLNGAFPLSEQRHVLELPDGRHMEYALFGAKQGKTCLYVHDAMFGNAWSAQMAEEASRRGLTIIAPLRAYWGGTDAYPDKCNVPVQFAQDVSLLLQTLELTDIVAISRTIGSAYAYRIVAEAPERFAGLVGAAPGLPMDGRRDLDRMMPHQKFLTGSIRHNKTVLKFLTNAIEAVYKRYGAKRLLRMVYRNYPTDLAVLEDPGAMAAMAAGTAQAAEQGSKAFFNDFKDPPKDSWGAHLNLAVPMQVLIGEQDPNGRLSRAQRLIDNGADITIIQVPEAGDLLLYSAYPAVLDAAETLFHRQELKIAASMKKTSF